MKLKLEYLGWNPKTRNGSKSLTNLLCSRLIQWFIIGPRTRV